MSIFHLKYIINNDVEKTYSFQIDPEKTIKHLNEIIKKNMIKRSIPLLNSQFISIYHNEEKLKYKEHKINQILSDSNILNVKIKERTMITLKINLDNNDIKTIKINKEKTIGDLKNLIKDENALLLNFSVYHGDVQLENTNKIGDYNFSKNDEIMIKIHKMNSLKRKREDEDFELEKSNSDQNEKNPKKKQKIEYLDDEILELDEKELKSFCQFPLIENKTKIIVTEQRTQFWKYVYESLDDLKKNINEIELAEKMKKILLTGPQGIGKSYTLLYIVNQLKKSFPPDKLKLLYISDCKIFSKKGFFQRLGEEMKFTFQEEGNNNTELAINNILKLKDYGSELILKLSQLINKYNELDCFTILICDQINSLNQRYIFNLEDISYMKWSLQIYSQSACNFENALWKDFIKGCEIKDYENFIERKSIRELITNIDTYKNMNLTDDKNFKKIEDVVGLNIREIILLLDQTGNLDEQIKSYSEKRFEEISSQNNEFQKKLAQKDSGSLERAIYYMDKPFYTEFLIKPVINKQFMKYIKSGESSYQIISFFPFASFVLKTISEFQEKPDFFEKQLIKLKNYYRSALNPSMRGFFYEEFNNSDLKNLIQKSKKIKLLLCHCDQVENKKDIVFNDKLLKEIEFFCEEVDYFYGNNKLIDRINRYSSLEKSVLLLPITFNNIAIDSYIFVPKKQVTEIIRKLERNFQNYLQSSFFESDLLIAIQIKHDMDVVYEKYEVILKKWEEVEKELIEDINLKTKFQSLLFIITQDYTKERKSFTMNNRKPIKNGFIIIKQCQ